MSRDAKTLNLRAKLLGLFCLFMLMFAGLGARPVLAHNSIDVSVPANGEVVAESPSDWSLTFAKDVPLESASAEIVGVDGVRTALPAARHGTSKRQILFSLPSGLRGEVTARWRLVGVDGHVISARVNFSVGAVTSATSVAISPGVASEGVPENSQVTSASESQNGEKVAPEPLRFGVRLFGYFALLLVGGMMITELFVAPGIIGASQARITLLVSAFVLGLAPLTQLLIFLDDSRGFGIVGSSLHLLESFNTTAGSMLMVRFMAGIVILAGVLMSARRGSISLSSPPMLVVAVVYLVSLGYVGHSRSMSWPILGIAADVVHTGAAAAWLGGLAVFVFFGISRGDQMESYEAFRRFGDVARYAVIAIVITGIIQTLRLHGSVITLLTENHGRWLLLKIGLALVMLRIGDINRRRLMGGLPTDESGFENRVALLRRASMTEIANGVLVMLVTAKLVTSSFN